MTTSPVTFADGIVKGDHDRVKVFNHPTAG
jgi:hypothetical protein